MGVSWDRLSGDGGDDDDDGDGGDDDDDGDGGGDDDDYDDEEDDILIFTFLGHLPARQRCWTLFF